MLASGAAVGLPQIGSAAESAAVPSKRSYSYHGRPDDYTEFRVIDPGRVIKQIETFDQGAFAIVRVTTADGQEGYGQIATYEEPCPYWELEWTAEVAAALKIPVAGGEQDNDLAQWRRMIRMNAVDIVQPDLCYVGGFTRAWRVAQMGQKAGQLVVPHSSHLSLITLFSLHFMAAIPNAGPVVEYSIEEDANAGEALYSPALKVVGGKVKIPDAPGWGVKINPAWMEKASYLKSERTTKL